jgi:hypothetical protein
MIYPLLTFSYCIEEEPRTRTPITGPFSEVDAPQRPMHQFYNIPM